MSSETLPPNMVGRALTQAKQWLAHCRSFRQWYRHNFLLRAPTADQEKLADQIQLWMIPITRALLSQMLDPEFPHRHLARSVEAVIWQLEEDWAARHNPMTDAEAEAIIHTSFPERQVEHSGAILPDVFR